MNKNIIYGIAGVIIGVIATLLLNGGMGGTGTIGRLSKFTAATTIRFCTLQTLLELKP